MYSGHRDPRAGMLGRIIGAGGGDVGAADVTGRAFGGAAWPAFATGLAIGGAAAIITALPHLTHACALPRL
jgi:hypothetical protein